MDDEFYNFHAMHQTDSPSYPEPISMEPNYTEYQQLKEPISINHVLHDYYNNTNVVYSHHHNHHHDLNGHERSMSPSDPNDPKMVMIRQINDDGKDWSEEDISDLETDAKNDILPPPSYVSTNIDNKTNPLLDNSQFIEIDDPNAPKYVNVNDLINNIGFGM